MNSSLKRRNFVLSPHTMRGAEHCEAARVYYPVERSKPTHAMWWGIAIHRFIQYAQKYDRDYALNYIKQKFPRAVNACNKMDLDLLPPGDFEVPFAIDLVDGTGGVSIGHELDPARHVQARVDLFSTALGVHVIDFKTGEKKIDPATSIQMATAAVGAWLDGDAQATEVRATIVNIVDGEFIPTEHIFDTAGLQAALKRLQRVRLLVLEARADSEVSAPEFEPGDHCSWCHVRSACPATRALKD